MTVHGDRDEKAIRRSTHSSESAGIVDTQQGPVNAFDLASFDTLRAHVHRLRSVLEGVSSERAEVCVQSCGVRLAGGHSNLRVAATVRLVVRSARTLSPILWQVGGVDMNAEAWAADLADVLTHESKAVQNGQTLSEPWTGTVVLDPWVASLLVHECIGHTSEADNYLDYAHPNGLSLGYRWTNAALTVVDDPTEPGRIGSYTVDDEGQPAKSTAIVDDGMWKELLYDRATAARMSVACSGNGRRVAGAAASLPRMSVLTVLPGDYVVERLIGEVKEGWYCSGSWGAGSIGRKFVLRPTYARRIRDGKLQEEYLRRFELRGDKFTTIAAIDAVGNDTRRFDPAFGCDKNGQDDLPVSFGAPHMRLQGITLAPIRATRASRP